MQQHSENESSSSHHDSLRGTPSCTGEELPRQPNVFQPVDEEQQTNQEDEDYFTRLSPGAYVVAGVSSGSSNELNFFDDERGQRALSGIGRGMMMVNNHTFIAEGETISSPPRIPTAVAMEADEKLVPNCPRIKTWILYILVSLLAVIAVVGTLALTNNNGTDSTETVFLTKKELQDAISAYLKNKSETSAVAVRYGYPIGTWDVSRIQDFAALFSTATTNGTAQEFNEDLSGWDTSQAVTLRFMFQGAAKFNQPLETWVTSSATDLGGMFDGALAFNQPLGTWDTSSVTDMSFLFSGAINFNQPLESWDTTVVESMKSMFDGAATFNQALTDWNVSSVTDMKQAFYNAQDFNQPLANWNVSSVENFEMIFSGATSFNQDLCQWTANLEQSQGIWHLGYLNLYLFSGTNCPSEEDPSVDYASRTVTGPLCHACEIFD